MKIAEAYVEMRVKSEQGKREAREQARSTAQEMTKTFAQYFSAAVVVGEMRKMTDAASNLEQAVGGTEAIFGKAATTIDRYAETSADALGLSERAFRELTSQIGGLLSGLGFTQQEAAATSVQLTQVGADLAAAFGGEPEEAVQALGAALRGEFDPLERFGVSLRQSAINLKAVEMGLAESETAVSDNARAQAALALITEQTANVQGQFGREADTAAGKQARFTAQLENQRAEIGEAMLPVYGALLDSLGFLLDRFGELPGPAQTAIVAMVGITAVAAPVKNTIEAFGGLTRMLKSVPPSAVAATAAVAVAYMAWQEFTAESRAAEQATRSVSAALVDSQDAFEAAATAAGQTATEVDDLAFALEALNDAILAGDNGDGIAQALGAVGRQAEDALDIFLQLKTNGTAFARELGAELGLTGDELETFASILNGEVIDGVNAIGKLPPELQEAGQALLALNKHAERTDIDRIAREFLNAEVASSELKDQLVAQAEANVGLSRTGEGALEVYTEYGRLLAENAEALDESTEGTMKFTRVSTDAARAQFEMATATAEVNEEAVEARQVTGRLRDEYDELADAADALSTAIDKVFGSYLDVDEAADNVRDSVAELTTSLEENEATLDANTQAGRNNRAAIRDQVDAIFDYAAAGLRAGDTTEDAANKVNFLTEQLRNQLTQAGLTEEEVDNYLETLGLTPENVTTAIELANKEIAKAEVEDMLASYEDLPEEIETEIQTLIDEGQYATAKSRLDALSGNRTANIHITTSGAGAGVGGRLRSDNGRFVAGGSNLISSLGEVPGSAGDEVVLPLGRPSRLTQLLSDPRVSGRVADAMPGASGGSTSIKIYPRGNVEVSDVSRALAMARMAG